MAFVPVETLKFEPSNPWGVANGTGEKRFRLPALLHAAITVGHGLGWRQSVQSELGGLSELLWKQYALLATVREASISLKGGGAIQRLEKSGRFDRMDPSEKRALTYHLGNTMATAWSRAVLGIPWLLHLDVYREQLDLSLPAGNSRPDLVGRNRDGLWIVIESKGRSTAPNEDDERKALAQAERVLSIGGVAPSLHLAAFSYFSGDRSAQGRRKPRVVRMRVIDPPGGDENSGAIVLEKLSDDAFFELYYQSWAFLFTYEDRLNEDRHLLWRDLKDIDLRIGIVPKLRDALAEQNFRSIPRVIADTEESYRLQREFPEWAGDGIVVEPGDSWKELFKTQKGQE